MSEPAKSVAFDRAASFYDTTRQLSTEAAARVIELLAAEVGGRDPVLEIGIGTGRIALPLVDRGSSIVGIDLSRPMLARLIEKTESRPRLAIADATRLSFHDAAFGAAYGVHVLHLIPNWRDAVAELVRVVRPGGVVVLDIGSSASNEGALHLVTKRFMEEAGLERRHPGVEDDEGEILDDAFARHGARARMVEPVDAPRLVTIDGFLQLLRGNVFSWTWSLDDATREHAADATLAWARDRFDDLGVPQEIASVVQWRAYDLPGG